MGDEKKTGVSVRGKRVFLSGPMTGIEDWNRKAFEHADGVCCILGARHVYSPGHLAPRTDHDPVGHEGWMAVYVLPTPGRPMKRTLFDGSMPSS